jgi:NAD(P)H dehydrogenase (quinone)
MNVLIVYAHPEAHSLNGALNAFAISHLENSGHHVQVSDLYAMNWKSQLDASDTLAPLAGDHFHPSLDSKKAFEQGLQSADIAGEQAKLRWADAVIFQFPLWWFSMPAIMKGGSTGFTPMDLPMVWANTATLTGAIAMARGVCQASGRCCW